MEVRPSVQEALPNVDIDYLSLVFLAICDRLKSRIVWFVGTQSSIEGEEGCQVTSLPSVFVARLELSWTQRKGQTRRRSTFSFDTT